MIPIFVELIQVIPQQPGGLSRRNQGGIPDSGRGTFATCVPFAAPMRASICLGPVPVAPQAPRGSRPHLPVRPVPAGSTKRARLTGAPSLGERARRSTAVVVRHAPEGGMTGGEAQAEATATAPMSVDLLTDRVNVATQARGRASKRIATLEAEVCSPSGPTLCGWALCL
jgi:hypothetical protein